MMIGLRIQGSHLVWALLLAPSVSILGAPLAVLLLGSSLLFREISPFAAVLPAIAVGSGIAALDAKGDSGAMRGPVAPEGRIRLLLIALLMVRWAGLPYKLKTFVGYPQTIFLRPNWCIMREDICDDSEGVQVSGLLLAPLATAGALAVVAAATASARITVILRGTTGILLAEFATVFLRVPFVTG